MQVQKMAHKSFTEENGIHRSCDWWATFGPPAVKIPVLSALAVIISNEKIMGIFPTCGRTHIALHYKTPMHIVPIYSPTFSHPDVYSVLP